MLDYLYPMLWVGVIRSWRCHVMISKNNSRKVFYLILAILLVSPFERARAVSFLGKVSTGFPVIKSDFYGDQSGASISFKPAAADFNLGLNLVFNNGLLVGVTGDIYRNRDNPVDVDLKRANGLGINVGYWSSGIHAVATYLPLVAGSSISGLKLSSPVGFVGQIGYSFNFVSLIPGIKSWPHLGIGPSVRYKLILHDNKAGSNVTSGEQSTITSTSVMLDVVFLF